MVIWLHGLGESSRCFLDITSRPELAHLHHVLPDLPGYGVSPRPVSPLPLEALARLMVRMAEDLSGGAPIIVTGHSMGGVLGVLMAEEAPALVKGLLNVDGNVTPGDCSFSADAAGMDLGAFIGGGMAKLLEKVRRGSDRSQALQGYHRSMLMADPATFHLHSRQLVEISAGRSMARRMSALTCPVRYLAGVPGGAAPESLLLLASEGVTTDEATPSGHWPFIDQPQASVESLLALAPPPGPLHAAIR